MIVSFAAIDINILKYLVIVWVHIFCLFPSDYPAIFTLINEEATAYELTCNLRFEQSSETCLMILLHVTIGWSHSN